MTNVDKRKEWIMGSGLNPRFRAISNPELSEMRSRISRAYLYIAGLGFFGLIGYEIAKRLWPEIGRQTAWRHGAIIWAAAAILAMLLVAYRSDRISKEQISRHRLGYMSNQEYEEAAK